MKLSMLFVSNQFHLYTVKIILEARLFESNHERLIYVMFWYSNIVQILLVLNYFFRWFWYKMYRGRHLLRVKNLINEALHRQILLVIVTLLLILIFFAVFLNFGFIFYVCDISIEVLFWFLRYLHYAFVGHKIVTASLH